MPSLWDRMYSAYQGALYGWREPGVRPGPNDYGYGYDTADEFGSRLEAYQLYWAFYDQSAFRDATPGMARMRATNGLYDGIRDLLGVAYQLGEFWPS